MQQLAGLGPLSAKLADTISRQSDASLVLEGLDPKLTIMTVPVLSNDNTLLGTVILEYSRDIYQQRVLETIRKVAASTAITLVILVPLGWLWGKQIASPLLRLSAAIRQVTQVHHLRRSRSRLPPAKMKSRSSAPPLTLWSRA